MDKIIYKSLGETMYTFTHPSGLPVRFIRKKGFARKFGALAVDFGSVNTCFQIQGEEITRVPQGIAHFLEHKLFEQEDGNVLEKYTRLGASQNAATGFSSTYYYFNCTDRFEECLRLLLHFVFHPYLTEENVEKEKGIIEQEIRMYEDDPYYQSMLGVIRLLYQNNPVIKISRPISMSIAPPKIPALPASLVPAVFPMRIPAKHMKKVSTPRRRQAINASNTLYSEIVKPTESASIEVAIPCTMSAPKHTAHFSFSSSQPLIPS